LFKIVVSAVASIVTFVFGLSVVSTDSNLLDQFDDDPKQAAKEVVLHYPAIFVLYNFLNAFVVAALVEEMVKYFGYRMVVTPDLLPGDAAPAPAGPDGAGAGPHGAEAGPDGAEAGLVDGSAAKGLASTGAGVTVAMVSTALGFACCENLMYVFVYSPPSLGVEISTLLARSLFPVHP
jgi:RsiW-degrading membrane proteinase PrsW (M82 family)